MKTSSAKAKGRKLQQFVRDRIIDIYNLPKEDVVSTSMGAQGVDVKLSTAARELFPFSVEAKSYKKVAVYNWFKQAEDNTDGQTSPLLVVKQDRSKPLVVLSWDTFEYLVRYINELRKSRAG